MKLKTLMIGISLLTLAFVAYNDHMFNTESEARIPSGEQTLFQNREYTTDHKPVSRAGESGFSSLGTGLTSTEIKLDAQADYDSETPLTELGIRLHEDVSYASDDDISLQINAIQSYLTNYDVIRNLNEANVSAAQRQLWGELIARVVDLRSELLTRRLNEIEEAFARLDRTPL